MDLLRLPGLGALLRSRHGRRSLQLAVLALAIAVVLHGLLGPQIAPRNLSTVSTSIHWRGLLVLTLLALGNLACTACPMMLVRDGGRRFIRPRLSWPRRLRRKWLGIALLIAVLFLYELFDLWQLPAATAWLILGYFALALLIDLPFKGAAFCKHVCPIGQFNYLAATMSPAELKVRDPGRCHDCHTHDCIKGRPAETAPLHAVRRGCELGLFMPLKSGNLDCTFCLDCVQACPHDNIALGTRLPGVELLETGRRSGIGRLANRPDLAVLAVVFTFAAFVSAFAMTAPAASLEHALAGLLRVSSEAVLLGLVFVLGLVVAPALILSSAAAATRVAARERAEPLAATAARYAFVLVPLGFTMWLAHYGFHLLTGIFTVVPVMQSAVIDLLGRAALGEPAWSWAGMAPGSVFPIQLGLMLLGACGSLALVHATSLRDYPSRPAFASVPWVFVVVALTAAALWILGQPMEMRGLGGTG